MCSNASIRDTLDDYGSYSMSKEIDNELLDMDSSTLVDLMCSLYTA